MTKKISYWQKIQLKLMRSASFNIFDGNTVADSLLQNKNLWDAAMFGRFCFGGHDYGYTLITLRDLGHSWNADTLAITTSNEHTSALEALARTWGADEIDWIKPEMAGRLLGSSLDYTHLLRVWWADLYTSFM